MKTQILAVWMMFAVVGGARIEAAEPRAEPDAGTVTGTALCRAQPGAGQTATVPKQTADAARASCTALTEAIGKCVHLENTVIWLGVWQQAQATGNAVYTNRLDFAELQQRIGRLTSELEAHADQLQTLIRKQNTIAP
jgi:hypothetical protein